MQANLRILDHLIKRGKLTDARQELMYLLAEAPEHPHAWAFAAILAPDLLYREICLQNLLWLDSSSELSSWALLELSRLSGKHEEIATMSYPPLWQDLPEE